MALFSSTKMKKTNWNRHNNDKLEAFLAPFVLVFPPFVCLLPKLLFRKTLPNWATNWWKMRANGANFALCRIAINVKKEPEEEHFSFFSVFIFFRFRFFFFFELTSLSPSLRDRLGLEWAQEK